MPVTIRQTAPDFCLNGAQGTETIEKDAVVLGISGDSPYTHLSWLKAARSEGGLGGLINIPLLSDVTRETMKAYGVYNEDKSGLDYAQAFRGLFLIDPNRKIRHIYINDNGVGRNVDETIRVIKGLQFSDEHGEVCPANWHEGQTTIAPTNAGTYPVTVSFTMQAGTAALEPVTSTLTITKVEQNAPAAPTASNIGTNSITVAAIPGAVFSIDGGANWQESTIFEGLTPDTDYTIQAKYPGDQNHYESPVSSAVIRTNRQSADAAAVQSAVYTYDGTPKTLVADVPTGCTQVIQTFTGTNGTSYGPTTEPPVNPGVYNVKVSYVMQSGYEELQPQYATLTINKATPAAPSSGASCVCWNSVREFFWQGKGPLLKKGLPSPCTPIPLKRLSGSVVCPKGATCGPQS